MEGPERSKENLDLIITHPNSKSVFPNGLSGNPVPSQSAVRSTVPAPLLPWRTSARGHAETQEFPRSSLHANQAFSHQKQLLWGSPVNTLVRTHLGTRGPRDARHLSPMGEATWGPSWGNPEGEGVASTCD